MRYLALLFISSAAIFASGCTGSYANNASAAANEANAAPTPPAASVTTNAGENECRICSFDMASYKGDLKKDEIDGLLLALNDEYLATATYQQVNKDFQDPRPFVNIVRAEMRHADMLKEIFAKYRLNVPENPWTGNVPKFAGVAEACKAGVQGEIVNRDLYTRLFKSTERKDILDVYRYLQRASEENHLPAFERCGSGGGRGPGGGPGRGPGGGRGPRGNG